MLKFFRKLHLSKILGIVCAIGLLSFNYSKPMLSIRSIAGDVHLQSGEIYTLPLSSDGLFSAASDDDAVAVSMGRDQTFAEATGISAKESSSNITIRLFGLIPVKQVNVHVRDSVLLMPGGTSIGVTLHTRGALVVGISNITLADGEQLSPAAAAGIQAGDLIEKINGIEIKDAAHLAEICNENRKSVELSILRNNEHLNVTLQPALDPSDGQLRMGMWVRDSTAGVGTLSFYDPESSWYAALGHAITDIDTRANLTVREGEIVQSSIVDIVLGTQGEPGELRGTFNSSSIPLGTIEKNNQYGIYGRMYKSYTNAIYSKGLEMAYPEEADVGDAELLTTLSEDGVKPYACKIIKINPQSSPAQKGMVVEITDPQLLASTGGIVQGMSGSPIIQDGKLIGVVTHVFINDPTKGYCMYAQWMHQQIIA